MNSPQELTLTINAECVAKILDQFVTTLEGREAMLAEIMTERFRQDVEWGGPDHDDEHSSWDWNRFIQYQLDHAKNIAHGVRLDDKPISEGTWRGRMVKIAALAIAAIESRDRVMSQEDPQ